MTDLFKDPQDQEDLDTTKNFLEELVGEGKKFKTEQDLARGKVEADRFIAQLQGEIAGIRQELTTRLTLEQFMDKMNIKDGAGAPSQNGSDNQEDRSGGEKQLSLEDIQRLIDEGVTKKETQRAQERNLEFVQQKLVESFGNEYVSKLKATSQETGLSEQALQNMAKESPKAFLKLVGATETRQQSPANSLFTPPANQARNPSGFQPTGEKTKSYYDELKKRNAAEYWSPTVQNQMHKDAQRLGERFFQ